MSDIAFPFTAYADPSLYRYCNADLNKRGWDFQPFVSALNLIIQKRASSVATRSGKNRYFFPAEQDRQNGLSEMFLAFKGFYSSARPSLGQVVLNVNVCMTPFYVSGTLLDAISSFQRRTQGALPTDFPSKAKIVTKHLGYNKTYTLTEVLGAPGPEAVFFECSKYKPPRTSVADYFWRGKPVLVFLRLWSHSAFHRVQNTTQAWAPGDKRRYQEKNLHPCRALPSHRTAVSRTPNRPRDCQHDSVRMQPTSNERG